MSQFEFRQGLYVSPKVPYIAVGVGIFVLAAGVQQIGLLGVYFYHVWQGENVWSTPNAVSRILNIAYVVSLGGLIFAGGRSALAAKKEAKRLKELYHDRPWMRNKQWAEGRIQTDHHKVTVFFGVALICLVAMLLVCLRALLLTPQADRSYWFVIALLVVIFVVIRCYQLNRKWRRSELRLGTIPGIIGGPLDAALILNDSFPEGTPFRVALKCEHLTWSFEGDSASHASKTLWQNDVVVDRFLETGIPRKTGIPVYFAIPFDCVPTTTDDRTEQIEGSAIQWLLEIKRDDNADFRSVQFEVPVFVTENSSPDYEEETNVLRQYSPAVTAESVLASMIYRRELVAGGERLVFSLRRWGFVLVAFVISLLCAVLLVAGISWLSPWPLVLIAALVPASLLAICVLAAFEMLLWRAVVTIRRDLVEVTAGYPGWTKRLSLTREDALVKEPGVEFITTHSDFRYIQIQSAAAAAAREAYFAAIENDEEVDESLGPPPEVLVTIIKRIPGRQAAEAVRNWLADRIREGESVGAGNPDP